MVSALEVNSSIQSSGAALECLQTGSQFRSGSAPLPIAPQVAADSHQPLAAALVEQMRLCGVDL